ncbi:MAG TPA: hypothetical protein PLM83_10980, partial [Bacillota bacterium]|nr:hypothetical protein [Bacillota bacterium]
MVPRVSSRWFRLLLMGVGVLALPASRAAVPAPTSAAAVAAAPWQPPPPPPDDFDWIQLKSGEWLKGRIKALQEDKLEFDSEELERQTMLERGLVSGVVAEAADARRRYGDCFGDRLGGQEPEGKRHEVGDWQICPERYPSHRRSVSFSNAHNRRRRSHG